MCFLYSQVCLSVNKISTDAAPDLSRDIKQLLIKLLLLAAKYADKLNIVPVFNIFVCDFLFITIFLLFPGCNNFKAFMHFTFQKSRLGS